MAAKIKFDMYEILTFRDLCKVPIAKFLEILIVISLFSGDTSLARPDRKTQESVNQIIQRFIEESKYFDSLVEGYLKKEISHKSALNQLKEVYSLTYGGNLKLRILKFTDGGSFDGDYFNLIYSNRFISCEKPIKLGQLEYQLNCLTRIQNGESNWVSKKDFIKRYGLTGVSQQIIDRVFLETKGDFSVIVKEAIQFTFDNKNKITKVDRSNAEWTILEDWKSE